MGKLIYVCGGCGSKYNKKDELIGSNRKRCPTCKYSLFMITSNSYKHLKEEVGRTQEEVFSFLCEYTKINKIPPTASKIQRELGIKNISTVYYHLRSLREKGLITFEDGSLHSLKILPTAKVKDGVLSLNKKQLFLLKEIDKYIQVNNKSPSYQELSHKLGFKSVATIAYHIEELNDLGFISKTNQHRSINLTNSSKELLSKFKEKYLENDG